MSNDSGGYHINEAAQAVGNRQSVQIDFHYEVENTNTNYMTSSEWTKIGKSPTLQLTQSFLITFTRPLFQAVVTPHAIPYAQASRNNMYMYLSL